MFKVGWEALQNEERRSSVADMSPEKKALYETLLTSPGQDPELQVSKAVPRNIWNGKRLLLADDLGLLESPRRAHEVDIEREGGVVVRGDGNVEEANIVVTKYRPGPTYVKVCFRASKRGNVQTKLCVSLVLAFRLKKMIGSFLVVVCQIDWQIFKTGGSVTPLPHPQKTIEGFSNHVCSFTMVAI